MIAMDKKNPDFQTFYELSSHLYIQMKECSLKTNLIDLLYNEFVNLYISCNIFAKVNNDKNTLRIWMEILNFILIHSSQKGDMLDFILDKEPSTGI